MLLNIQLPLPDQPLDDYLAALWQRNGRADWERCFGSIYHRPWETKNVFIRSSGGRLFHQCKGLGYSDEGTFWDKHSYAPVLKPVMSEFACIQMCSGKKFLHLNVIQDFPRYCVACMREDLQFHGKTYARRIHQIRGVAVCVHHDEVLTPPAASRQIASDLSHAEHVMNQLGTQQASMRSAIKPAVKTFAQFVSAAMNLQLRCVSRPLRFIVFAKRLSPLFAKSPTRSDFLQRLQERIAAAYDISFLEEVGGLSLLNLSSTLDAICMRKQLLTDCLAEFALLALLFDDPEDYNAAVDQEQFHHRHLTELRLAEASLKHVGLSFSLTKKLMSGRDLHRVQESHSISPTVIDRYLRSHPKLARRRAHHRARYLHRVEIQAILARYAAVIPRVPSEAATG